MTNQSIEVHETRIAYLESGSGDVFVCLHDLWDCNATFHPLMQWANWGRWVALDLPGFGGSALPAIPCYGLATIARLVSEALEQLGLYRVILVGHGFGAMVASWIALHDAERVAGLCLVQSSFQAPTLPLGLRVSRRAPFRWLSRYLLGERILRWRLRSRMQHKPNPERSITLAQTFIHHRQERLAMMQSFRREESEALVQGLSGLRVPVLCLQSAESNVSWMESLPNAKRENITNCGQYPHEEQPEQVAAALQNWLGYQPKSMQESHATATPVPTPEEPPAEDSPKPE
jgi:pimeloyl-ACP methyl ester carboxylesterase